MSSSLIVVLRIGAGNRAKADLSARGPVLRDPNVFERHLQHPRRGNSTGAASGEMAARLSARDRGVSENCSIFRTHTLPFVRNLSHISDMPIVEPDTDLRSRLLARIESKPDEVWTPGDFADLGARAAVDKTLQRLAAAGELRRIDRGLYDRPRTNNLTGRATVPDYRAVIRAVTRRDRARAVIDGMTAANDLGLTTAVPARIEVLVDARLKPIKLGTQEIHFKYAAPSRLYWADRPGMRVVQALHWMQDMLTQKGERKRIQATLRRLFADPKHGEAIREDLRAGLSAVPIWMQEFLREILRADPHEAKP